MNTTQIVTRLITAIGILTVGLAYQVMASPFDPPSMGEVIGGQVADIGRSIQEAQKSTQELTREVRLARSRYFGCRPSCDDKEELAAAFSEALGSKDLYHLSLDLSSRSPGNPSIPDIFTRQRSVPSMREMAETLAGKVDGGTPDECSFEFMMWVSAVGSGLGKGIIPDYSQLIPAIERAQPRYRKYVVCRDQWEWDHRPMMTIDFDSPESYLYGVVRYKYSDKAESEWAERLDELKLVYGEETMIQAAGILYEAPKISMNRPFYLAENHATGCFYQKAFECLMEKTRELYKIPENPQVKSVTEHHGVMVHYYGIVAPDFIPPFPADEHSRENFRVSWGTFENAPGKLSAFGVSDYSLIKRHISPDPARLPPKYRKTAMQDEQAILDSAPRVLRCDFQNGDATYFWYGEVPKAAESTYLRSRNPTHPILDKIILARTNCPSTQEEAQKLMAQAPAWQLAGDYKYVGRPGNPRTSGTVHIEKEGDDIYKLVWNLERRYEGVGYVDGRVEKGVRLICNREEDGNLLTITYVLMDHGELVANRERLTPMHQTSKPADTADTVPDGSSQGYSSNPGTVVATQLKNPPELLVRKSPVYPQRAQSRGITGSVTLNFSIDLNGTVQKIKIVSSHPPGVFDRAALKAVQGYKYRPAKHNGGTVVVKDMQETVTFQIEESLRPAKVTSGTAMSQELRTAQAEFYQNYTAALRDFQERIKQANTNDEREAITREMLQYQQASARQLQQMLKAIRASHQ